MSIHVDYPAAGSGNANRRNSLAAVKSRFEESMKSIVPPLESTAGYVSPTREEPLGDGVRGEALIQKKAHNV